MFCWLWICCVKCNACHTVLSAAAVMLAVPSAVLSAMPVLSAAAVMVALPSAVICAMSVLSAAAVIVAVPSAVFVAATWQVAAQAVPVTGDAGNAFVLLFYGELECLLTKHAQTPSLLRVSGTTAQELFLHFQGHSCIKVHRCQGLSCAILSS
jgi:hypothetical protein